ncbi:MAG: CBS domain-containing protein [Armatimonadota bacterium]
MIARELMQTDIPTLSLDDSLQEAAELLTRYENSNIAVLDEEGRIVGMVGENDILAIAMPTSAAGIDQLSYLPRCYGLRNLSDDKLQDVTVEKVMRTEDIVTVEENELIAQVALLIMRHHQPQVFVVSDGKYVGRVGRKHIISEVVDPHLGVACHP